MRRSVRSIAARRAFTRGDTAYFSGDARHTIVRRSTAGFPRSPNDEYPGQFGSAHRGLSHFAFLDAAVHTITHDLETELLTRLAVIGDRGQIPDDIFED